MIREIGVTRSTQIRLCQNVKSERLIREVLNARFRSLKDDQRLHHKGLLLKSIESHHQATRVDNDLEVVVQVAEVSLFIKEEITNF